ncbi:MAG TPA: DNA-processing protein DprA [bacterium]|nr:DNA-processing protein DprA [bacterium]
MNEGYVDLYAVPRMNETRLKNLLARFRTPERVFAAGLNDLLEVKGVDQELAAAVRSYRRSDETERRLKAARELGIRTIGYGDRDYPENLKKLAHMPPVLFVRGDLLPDDRTAAAVVGTRVPSHYGRQVAEKLGHELAQHGVTVVSGLARGVDTFAHKGALDGGGRTLAVLGCGIDVFYPPENRRLYEAIAARGAVMSEFSLGVEPLAMNFPKRNRVVSGLSRAVVAVEAGEKSGVLNTVAWATDQGRAVFAVPGNITSQQSLGINRLLKNGARPLISVDDVLLELGVAKRADERSRVEVAAEEKPVMEFLTDEPAHVDEICEGLGMPMAGLLSVLMQLEIKGLVRQLPGKYFVKEI